MAISQGGSGLREVDPSPVDESPVDVKKEEYFTTDGEAAQNEASQSKSSSPSSASSGLGLSGHSPAWYRKFSRISSTPRKQRSCDQQVAAKEKCP